MQKVRKAARTAVSDWRFLVRAAYSTTPRLLRDTVLTTLCDAAKQAAWLFAIPLIVHAFTASQPVWQWAAVVVGATAGWCCLQMLGHLAHESFEQSRDAFRTRGCTALTRRALTLSYPLATDPAFSGVLKQASNAMGHHIHAPIPHLWHTVSSLTVSVIGAVLTALVMSCESAWLTVLTVVTAAASAFLHRLVTVRGNRDAKAEAAEDEKLAFLSSTADAPTYAKDMRVFGVSDWIRDIHDRTLQAVRAFVERRAKIYALYSVADALLALLRNGAAYALLIATACDGNLTPASTVLLFLAIGGLSQSVCGLVADALSLRAEWPSLTTYRRCMEQADLFVTEGGVLPMAGPLHTIELRHVTVSYPQADRPVFDDLSLTLHEGERLAVIGEDGVGKTTLARLLCGLIDPDKGTVLLDGTDIKTLDRRAYYALFSTVFADSTLPPFTVAELVGSACDTLEEARVWACLSQVGLEEAVRALPRGIHTPLGDTIEGGVSLSGGQISRLKLACALYKDGDVLVLDEPQTALDPLAERALMEQYDRMTAGKSAVFLSCRAPLMRFCDRILLLKDGRIAEEGTHDALMRRGGDYAAMVELQSRYYREGRDPDDGTVG